MKKLTILLLLVLLSQLYSYDFVTNGKRRYSVKGELKGVSEKHFYIITKGNYLVILSKADVGNVYNGNYVVTNNTMNKQPFMDPELAKYLTNPDSTSIKTQLTNPAPVDIPNDGLVSINQSIKSIATPLWISLIVSIISAILVFVKK